MTKLHYRSGLLLHFALVLNLAYFSSLYLFTLISRQKALLYTLLLGSAILLAFFTTAVQTKNTVELERLATPPQFVEAKQTYSLNRTEALSMYAALRAFTLAHQPAAQLNQITAALATWLDKPEDAKLLQNQAIVADPLITCALKEAANGTSAVYCE